MTTTDTTEDMYRAVYNHLYDMNKRLVSAVFPKITVELMAIMSHDAYSEMIQMAQKRTVKDYYERLKKGAV